MICIIVLTVIFLTMGIIFLLGKGGFLIAGYNTADEKEKSRYDERKLNACCSIFCFGMAALIGIMGYIDSESFTVHAGLPGILLLVLFLFISTGTYCKRK